MSELKTALFGQSEDIESAQREEYINGEISGQLSFADSYEPVITEYSEDDLPQTETPDSIIQDSMDAVEKMKKEIAAENENLNKRFSEVQAAAENKPVSKQRHVYVVGVLSAAASLIFMGIMILVSLSSPIGIYAAIKASPVILVFVGADLIFAVVKQKDLHVSIDIRSAIIAAALIVISSVMTLISAAASAGNGERVYAEQRIQNMLASELHDTIAHDYIRSVDIETQLFGEDAQMYVTPADLTEGDIINLTVNFSDAQMTIREFARECRQILDDMRGLSYNFGHVDFIASDNVNRYSLGIDWHYQSDYTADRLAAYVNYFGDDIADNDIPDLTED